MSPLFPKPWQQFAWAAVCAVMACGASFLSIRALQSVRLERRLGSFVGRMQWDSARSTLARNDWCLRSDERLRLRARIALFDENDTALGQLASELGNSGMPTDSVQPLVAEAAFRSRRSPDHLGLAIREFSRCIEMRPGHRQCHVGGIVALAQAMDTTGLRTWSRRALARWPNDPWFRAAWGLVLLGQGHPQKALEWLPDEADCDERLSRERRMFCRMAYVGRTTAFLSAGHALEAIQFMTTSTGDDDQGDCPQQTHWLRSFTAAANQWHTLRQDDSAAKYDRLADGARTLCLDAARRRHPRADHLQVAEMGSAASLPGDAAARTTRSAKQRETALSLSYEVDSTVSVPDRGPQPVLDTASSSAPSTAESAPDTTGIDIREE